MMRYLVIIAFLLSAVTACDSSDKAVKQEKAAEAPAEQLNETTENKAGTMTDAMKDTAGEMLEGAENMAEDMGEAMGEASSDAYGELKDATKTMMDDTEEAVDDTEQEAEK